MRRLRATLDAASALSFVLPAIVLCACASRPAELPEPRTDRQAPPRVQARCTEAELVACPRACREGEASACTLLGRASMNRPGSDPDETLRWLRRGCALSDPEACYLAAVLLQTFPREGESEDTGPLLQRACRAAHGPACLALALRLEARGNPGQAARWLERGCELGVARACFNLGVMHHQGAGVKLDLERAAALYEQACASGEPVACSDLGVMLREGQGGAVDHTRARELFERACTERIAAACYNLGLQHEEGRGGPPDATRAATLYGRACDGGELRACNNLGLLHEEGIGVGADPTLAAQLYERACEGGLVSSCVNLGALLELGKGVKRDPERAKELYERACRAGVAAACGYAR
ncbi:MAG: tetratricopeptide repeat protein [Myxococcota bacterium]